MVINFYPEPCVPLLLACGLGFLAQFFSKEGLTLHDRIAGSVVLRGAPAAIAPVATQAAAAAD